MNVVVVGGGQGGAKIAGSLARTGPDGGVIGPDGARLALRG